MPARLLFFLAYRLLACSTLLNVGFSSPIKNVEVVPLGNSGDVISSIVLPNGVSGNKNRSALETGTDAKPVSLLEQGDKSSNIKSLSLDSSSSAPTSRLVDAEKVTSTSLTKQTNLNGTEDQIAKLIERPSNGKSFFADQTTTNPNPKSEGNQDDQRKPHPAGLGDEPKRSAENTGSFPAVKLLSEKPLVTPQSAGEENKTAEGKGPAEAKLVVEPKPPSEAQWKEALPAKKDSGEASKKPNPTEINNAQSRKDPKVDVPKQNDIILIGKDVKPLFEKPTSTASPKEESDEAPVLLSLERIAEEEPNEAETKAIRGPKQTEKEKNSRPEEASKSKSADAQGKHTEDKPQKSLPTVDSAKDLGPEPTPKSPPPTAPKAAITSPPPAEKSPAGPESPESKEKFPEAQHMRMAGNPANTLSVVQGGSDSTPTKDSEGPHEEKSPSKLIYIGGGVVGLLVLLVSFILFAKKKQQKEKQLPEGEKSRGVQSEIPIEFGSGEGASQISTPLSPPMSLNGKSERGIPVALPTPRGDEDLVGGKSLSRQLRSSNGYEGNYSTGYGSEYGRDQYGQDVGSVYDESEFYDNSRYRGGHDLENRGRVDSFPSRRSSGRASPKSERGRFPYNRR